MEGRERERERERERDAIRLACMCFYEKGFELVPLVAEDHYLIFCIRFMQCNPQMWTVLSVLIITNCPDYNGASFRTHSVS